VANLCGLSVVTQYLHMTRLSTHNAQESSGQEKLEILKHSISLQLNFFTKIKNESEAITKVSFQVAS
jgi:hypothetical protein